jgi:hypothetical protein
MKMILELTSRVIAPSAPDQREEHETIMSGPILRGNKTAAHARYEDDVLLDGKRLLVEVKFCMNWLKACQAEWQFRQFLKRFDKDDAATPGAIVFFEKFSGDWNRRRSGAKNLWGWEAWYLYYRDAIDGKRIDLLMLRSEPKELKELTGYPLV